MFEQTFLSTPEDLSLVSVLMTLPFKGRSPVVWGRRLAWIKAGRVSAVVYGYMPGAHAILGSNPSGPTTIIQAPMLMLRIIFVS